MERRELQAEIKESCLTILLTLRLLALDFYGMIRIDVADNGAA